MIKLLAPFTLLLASASAWAAGLAAFSGTPGSQPPAPWHTVGLPERYNKPVSQFDLTDLDGTHVLRVKADKSWGTLAHPVNEVVKPGSLLKWRWRLEQPLAKADIHAKATEDSPLKVCLSFDMPADSIPSGERALFKLAQLFSKEKIPTATLCYIWGSKETIGYEQASLFTARVRFIVVANETTPLKAWQNKERNIHADFLKAFGHESAAVPALSAILIGADADNTLGSSTGYVGDVQFINPPQ
ncbi:DUF3047 domain-containing protein [Variovorax sp. PCZ-1]|uniref:DUF3047 domain-containing protein n=1 Tax=Variovorax sp. PCZ-1 TaxID=2835533 RepID=UPI001BD0E909|nr:DUF3047 domain-containing protein [Variovorax sp. PCZ-1]MBS7807453.1 DUF3047 domain-containing protein [Variovorax sp. PCZ-1]